MAMCKWCSRSGFFLSVDGNGLCKSCAPGISLEVASRLRVLNESVHLAGNSKKLETKLSRCDLVIAHATALERYEVRGIPVCNPPPSSFRRRFEVFRKGILVEQLEADEAAFMTKLGVLPSLKARLTEASKFLVRITAFRQQNPDVEELAGLAERVEVLQQREQLAVYLEEAKRAEFKHHDKKALGHYYDALYFLRNDKVDDALQYGEIAVIEEKIKSLGGEIK